jgi:hypothetical protein
MTDPETKTDNDIKDEAPILRCSICDTVIMPDPSGWTGGNNAQPVNDGRCCNDCNTRVVIPMRLQRILNRRDQASPHG